MWILIIALILIAVFIIRKKFKSVKVDSLTLISGGVKTGKTTLAVHLALKEYKSVCRKVKIVNFFRRIFKREELPRPLLYSNIPLDCPYVPLTKDLLLREKRFVYKSVILVSEASLVADSQLIKVQEINQDLLLFNKLIAHETHGGKIFYDTQSISDLHYSIKRCLSSYLYIHHTTKWIPFFLFMKVREDRYSEDNNVVNINDKDVEDTLKTVIIPKRVWKKFDCYCYSTLTDDLPVVEGEVLPDSLKADNIVSFRDYKKKEIKK